MLEKQYIQKHLAKTNCYSCSASLETAKLTTVSQIPSAFVAYAKCLACGSENMVTITSTGSGSFALTTDLSAEEIKKFVGARVISYDELLEVHKLLQKRSLCKLLQKKENNLGKKQKILEKSASFRL